MPILRLGRTPPPRSAAVRMPRRPARRTIDPVDTQRTRHRTRTRARARDRPRRSWSRSAGARAVRRHAAASASTGPGQCSQPGGSVLWTPASPRFTQPPARFRLPIWAIGGASWSRSGRRPRSCSGRSPARGDASAAMAVAGTGSPTDARPDRADPGLPLRSRRGAHGQRAPARVRLGAGLRRVPAPLGCERRVAVHPFDSEADYRTYIDGRRGSRASTPSSRAAGSVSRRDEWDSPTAQTACGLAVRKGRLSSAASCSAGSRLSRACTATSMRRAAPGSRGP